VDRRRENIHLGVRVCASSSGGGVFDAAPAKPHVRHNHGRTVARGQARMSTSMLGHIKQVIHTRPTPQYSKGPNSRRHDFATVQDPRW